MKAIDKNGNSVCIKEGTTMAVRPNLNRHGIVTIHEICNDKPAYSRANSYSADMVYLKNAKPYVLKTACKIFNSASNKFPCASIVGSIMINCDKFNWIPVFYNPRKDPYRFLLVDGTRWNGSIYAKIQGTKMWACDAI